MYVFKYEYDWLYYFGESSNLKSDFFVGFVINFGKYCWNDVDEKIYDYSKIIQQFEKGGFFVQNDEFVM